MSESKTLSIISLICGAISIFTLVFPLISALFAVVGLVIYGFSKKANEAPNEYRTTALIASVISMVVSTSIGSIMLWSTLATEFA